MINSSNTVIGSVYAVAYVACVIMAQATASTFISLPLGISVAVGTLWFGCTFTLRDTVHAALGRRGAYAVIAVAIAASCAETVLLGVPSRIILASVIATAIAESTDTEVYHANKHRSWLIRAMRSNAVSIPVDTLVFNYIAFSGVIGSAEIVSLSIGTITVKAVVSTIVCFARS